jgi:hypothetical protein
MTSTLRADQQCCHNEPIDEFHSGGYRGNNLWSLALLFGP